MADKTLIQGARELAASKATSGIGAAMSAGFSGVQERAAARNAELAKQGRKEAEAIQTRTAKLMGGWKGLNINEGEFSQAQRVEIDKTLINIKKDFSDASTALGKDPTNLDLIEKRKGYMQEMVSYKSALDNYADRSEAWKNPPAKNSKYSDSEANVSNLALNERAYTNPVIWNREQQGLFIPGKEGGEATSFGAMAMPFYLPEGILSGIASEAGKLSAARKSELTKTQLEAYEIKLKDTIGAKNPNEGINNAPALLANNDFRLLFPELNDIVYTEENNDAIVQEMTDVIMSRYKFISTAANTGGKSKPANPVVKSMEDIQDHYNLGKTGVQYSADDLKFIFGSTTNPISVVYNPKRKESPWEMTRKTLDPADGTLSTETIYFRNVEDLQQRSGIKF